MNGRSFALRVFPQGEREFGVAVEQAAPLLEGPQSNGTGRAQPAERRAVVRAWGVPLRAVTAEVLDALRRSGHRASALDPRSPAAASGLALDETAGVRLALLLLAVKPLRKHQRIDQVAAGVRAMSDEEAYYWYSKCADRRDGRRAQHALRVMLSPER